ncbi:MAG TPA: hypothetical protein VHN14_19560 [Kofleriaceae bacterium]|jgi:photosystem II stability/assembly factor-like uncharacterized protein|nr:hypothetical protein [Kofleriaceae bacterium]
MKAAILCVGLLLAAGACKKSGTGGGGGGGGGGGWLVGADGLMLHVESDGSASGYDAASTESLNGIACRYSGEAWVAGSHGTLLYTDDAGATWQPQPVPTTADLRALATQNFGPVFVAGNGVFLTSTDTGAHWKPLGDGKANFRSLAAAQDAPNVLAVADDGGLWSYENQQLVKLTQFAGARAVAVSPDGQTAIVVGDNLIAKSSNAGHTWSPLASTETIRYDDVRVDENGQAVAVGSGGAIAHIAIDGSVVMQHIGAADLHTIHISEIGEDYESVGFAAGDGGHIWITRDGGWSWNEGPNAGHTVLGVDEIGDGHR